MISIIIPTLNEEKYLPRLLSSIKIQDYKNYEIIISDAGSTDRTLVIAQNFGTKVVVNSVIKHPSAQRNNGAKIAQGDILLFLDADSVLSPGFLSSALSSFEKRNLSAAGFYIKFNPNRWYYNIYSFISNSISYLRQSTRHPAAVGAGLMSKLSLHEKIFGFDLEVTLAEDYDYCARATEFGRFRMITGCHLLYSSRRMEKEGFFCAGWKWLKMGIFTLTNRRIIKKNIKYEFGKF